MGCNCGKSKASQVPGAGAAAARRATIYQVLADSTVVSEHGTLPEARIEATKLGGRVKVVSKIVT